MSVIGENIAKRRKELGLTQEDLAARMGYKSKSSINKIEMGVNDIPQSKVVAFAEVLHTTPAYLMGWVEEETHKKNDVISDIVIKAKTDSNFYSVMELLLNDSEFLELVAAEAKMDKAKRSGLAAMVKTLV